MEKMKTSIHRGVPFLLLAFVVILQGGSGARAQSGNEACNSFIVLTPDSGGAYTFPLQYGTFADVEVGAAFDGTVQIEVTVFEDSAIKDRRLWTLIPGRVELLTEILDVPNLFEVGRPLLVRMIASGPVSAMLVRR
jgi:hypothetical protein